MLIIQNLPSHSQKHHICHSVLKIGAADFKHWLMNSFPLLTGANVERWGVHELSYFELAFVLILGCQNSN